MIDIQWIRDHPNTLDNALKKRHLDPLSEQILALDAQVRHLKTSLQEIRTRKNALAEKTAQQRAAGESTQLSIQEASALKEEESQKAEALRTLEHTLQERLSWIPNLLDDAVPLGKDDADNIQLRCWGDPCLPPSAKTHIELAEGLGCIDMKQAAQIAGSRFSLIKGSLARLERALGHWMLDVHCTQFGYTEVSPPYLVHKEAAFGAGNLPKFAAELFETTDGRFLIPTAEMALVSTVAHTILDLQGLPLRLTALTPCFRSEAGAAGRDTHGLMRMHQFHKVELVVICAPEHSASEHERIVSQGEYLLQQLGLPYRVMQLCSGDTGFASHKTYDIEVFVPSENRYREIASCSNCGEFQARRVSSRFRDAQGKIHYTHMLNGSGLPIGRTLLALIETYQNPDGSIALPSVLHPYMNGVETLK